MRPDFAARALRVSWPIAAVAAACVADDPVRGAGGASASSTTSTSEAVTIGPAATSASSASSSGANGIDDWPELGHDARRSYATTDTVAPPFERAWTWSAITKPGVDSALNSVSANGRALVQLIGKTEGDAGPNAPVPAFAIVRLDDGGTDAIVSATATAVDPALALAATKELAIVDVGGCGAIDLATFAPRFQCGDVDGECQKAGSLGETLVDVAGSRFVATNRAQLGDPSASPSSCLPPANVSAYDLATGAPRWTALVARFPATLDAHVALAGDAVLVAAHVHGGPAFDGSKLPDDGLYALDAATGKERWRATIPGTTFGRVATDGATVWAVAIASDTRVAAFDAATGAPRFLSPPLANSAIDAVIGFEKDHVLAFLGGSFAALDRATGAIAWTVQGLSASLSTNGFATSEPAGLAYVTTSAGVAAVGLHDGKIVGELALPKIGNIGAPILARGELIVTGTDAVAALRP